MEYNLGIKLDRIEQMLAYLIEELEKNKKGESKNEKEKQKSV